MFGVGLSFWEYEFVDGEVDKIAAFGAVAWAGLLNPFCAFLFSNELYLSYDHGPVRIGGSYRANHWLDEVNETAFSGFVYYKFLFDDRDSKDYYGEGWVWNLFMIGLSCDNFSYAKESYLNSEDDKVIEMLAVFIELGTGFDIDIDYGGLVLSYWFSFGFGITERLYKYQHYWGAGVSF